MRNRLACGIFAVSTMLALTACGGGGSGGGVSTPAPPPSFTPAPTPTGATLANLSVSRNFKNEVVGFEYTADPQTGKMIPGTGTSAGARRVSFRYDHVTESYTLQGITAIGEDGTVLFKTEAPDLKISDSKFVRYSLLDGEVNKKLSIYRYGSSNPELRLTYSSFGRYTSMRPLGHLNFSEAWFAYGIETEDGKIPVSGTARYSGVLYGSAVSPDASKQFDLKGTSTFSLNFGTKRASGELTFTAVAGNGSAIDAGAARFDDALIFQADGYRFDGNLTGPGIEIGMVEGLLFGPNAAEVGGTFAASMAIDSPFPDYRAVGAFAAVRD